MSENAPFTIALPAGRLAAESVEFFKKCKLAEFQIPEKTRELLFYDTTGQFRILMVRNQDVPTYVQQGGADAGISGRDVLAERGYELTVPLELNFGECRLSLAAEESKCATLLEKPHLRVATKYPRLAMDYFFKKGISCEVIKLYGSIEIAPLLGMADCIVDLVSTGATLKANGLKEIEVMMESSAMLVLNRSAFALQTQRVNFLLERFRTALAEDEAVASRRPELLSGNA